MLVKQFVTWRLSHHNAKTIHKKKSNNDFMHLTKVQNTFCLNFKIK